MREYKWENYIYMYSTQRFIDESMDLIGEKSPDFKFEKLLSSKIGRALLNHIQKFPDVLKDNEQVNHSLDAPQGEDL